MVTIALSSFKGGTGKSSLSVLLGNAWAASGRRVLVVDLDHQRNTTAYHATDPNAIADRNIAEAFHRGTLEGNVLESHIDNTDFVAGSFGILQQRAASPRTLDRILEPIRGAYDVAVVDCPPTLDNIVLNAWNAADRIVTPARLDGYDMDGVAQFGKALQIEVPDSGTWTVVLNGYRSPRSSSADSLGLQLEAAFAERYPNLFPVRIPDTVAVYRAVHNGEAITTARRTAKVYAAIVALASELIGETVTPKGGSI